MEEKGRRCEEEQRSGDIFNSTKTKDNFLVTDRTGFTTLIELMIIFIIDSSANYSKFKTSTIICHSSVRRIQMSCFERP